MRRQTARWLVALALALVFSAGAIVGGGQPAVVYGEGPTPTPTPLGTNGNPGGGGGGGP